MPLRRLLAVVMVLAASRVSAAPPADPPAPHYEVRIELSPEAGTLKGDAEIAIARSRVGSEYRFLLGRTFTIDEVSATGATVRVENTDRPFPQLQAIVIKPVADAPNTIRVKARYSGKLLSLQSPPINMISPELIELTVDSMWLPFSEEFNVGLTADASFRGIPSNAVAISTGRVRRNGKVVRIVLDRPNDLTLIASPKLKQFVDGKLTLVAADPNSPQARIYRRHGRRGIAYLEDLLGPIPGGTSRLVVVQRESRAGYNRPGYMVVSERPLSADEWLLAGDLVHEISHAWWSKANFLNEDYWLVEGPANYYMHRYGVEAFGEERLGASLAKSLERARKAAAIGGSRPNSDTAYAKGELLLRLLEQEIGRDKFDRFMRVFAAEPRHTTQGFIGLLLQHADRDVAERFERRLRSPGIDG